MSWNFLTIIKDISVAKDISVVKDVSLVKDVSVAKDVSVVRDVSEFRLAVTNWVQSECAPWTKRNLSRNEAQNKLASLNETVSTIFLYDLDVNGAKIADKKGIYEKGRPTGSQPVRALLYLKFFDEVCKGKLQRPTRIAVDVDDLCPDWESVPVFTFQKKRGAKNLLLPDIDFLATDFYAAHDFWCVPESAGYFEKKSRAAFVGSTTGVRTIVKEDLEANRIPRIRSARYFRNDPDIIFLLTKIVQTASEVEHDMLVSEGFGTGHVNWKEQLENRFIVSADGNGATCSRVYIGLMSNSCLLKYESDFVLYYFRGMRKWREYVPVYDDEDLRRLLKAERTDASPFAFIADAGRQFATNYLNRDMVLFYTLKLLESYTDLMS